MVQPLPVAVDLHADVLGVSHDCSLDETLHVVVVEGLGAGARGAILGSVGHALGRCVTRVAANDRPRVRGGAAVRLEQDDVEPQPFRVPVRVVAFDVLDPALAGGVVERPVARAAAFLAAEDFDAVFLLGVAEAVAVARSQRKKPTPS